jgi:hypothetical protein
VNVNEEVIGSGGMGSLFLFLADTGGSNITDLAYVDAFPE